MELNKIVEFAFPDWQVAMIRLTVIYRILECGDEIPLNTKGTGYEFIESVLDDMHNRDLLDISDNEMHYVVTQKAKDLRAKLVEVYDHTLKFEIFGTVNVALELSDDITDDEGGVLDHCYDPRFQELQNMSHEEAGTTDMRIAVMRWLSESAAEEDDNAKDIDPKIIVFMQWLCDGKLKKDDIWFDLKAKTFFNEVEEIVEGSYQWRDVSDDEEEAWNVMETIYTAGLLEQRKRDNFECSACGIPLGVFEMNAEMDGEKLTHCPNPECGASYEPPEPPTYECPHCGSEIKAGQRSCTGCGAEIDFSMAAGTVATSEETVVTEESVVEDDYLWDYDYGYYGYSPYGYYDPYSPMVDALVFCAAVDMLYY